MITTQQLAYLVAIDRHATWGEAASAIGVSPSALSQGVAELERRLGVSLFERDGRMRVPTRDHAEVLRYAEQTLAATEDLERWLQGRATGESGVVRLGMIDAAATYHFRDVLRSYRDARPDVELRLTVAPSRELLVGLTRSALDIVVCVQPAETPQGIVTTPLVDDPLAVLAPPGSRGHRTPKDWGPWVTFPSGSHTRALIATALASAGATFEVVAESHQPEVLREMVLLGVGWTVLPVAGLAGIEELEVIQPSLTQRRLVLARRAGASPNPAADELATALAGSTNT